ncbi:MAG TPA: hypothetical protein VKR06_16325 [Ktedonosporobacter sp.]|nr:hypothetical protein [Ktedonosporobacter sp.]
MIPTVKKSIFCTLALLTFATFALSLALLTPWTARANTVAIDDQAHVLDVSSVQAEAAKLSAGVFIYTTTTFTGDQDALNQDARNRLPNQQTIDIGIDTVNRNVSVQAGTGVKISTDQAQNAVDAFINQFKTGGYSGATIAALDSLQTSLTGSSEITPAGKVVLGIVLTLFVLLIVLVVRAFRRRLKNPPDKYTRQRRSAYRGSSSSHSSSDVWIGSSSSWDSGSSSGGGGDFGGGAGGHF